MASTLGLVPSPGSPCPTFWLRADQFVIDRLEHRLETPKDWANQSKEQLAMSTESSLNRHLWGIQITLFEGPRSHRNLSPK